MLSFKFLSAFFLAAPALADDCSYLSQRYADSISPIGVASSFLHNQLKITGQNAGRKLIGSRMDIGVVEVFSSENTGRYLVVLRESSGIFADGEILRVCPAGHSSAVCEEAYEATYEWQLLKRDVFDPLGNLVGYDCILHSTVGIFPRFLSVESHSPVFEATQPASFWVSERHSTRASLRPSYFVPKR